MKSTILTHLTNSSPMTLALSRLTLTLVCGATVFSARPGNAALVPYFTDFENLPGPYTVNESVVGQPEEIYEAWYNLVGSANDSIVINDPTGSGRGQILSIANGGGVQQYFFNAFPTMEDIVISYQTYGAAASNVRDRAVWFHVSDNAAVTQLIANISIDGGGYFTLNDTNPVVGILPELETWYTVTLTLRRSTQTLDLSITDGVSTGSLEGIPYYFPSLTNQLGKIQFNGGVYNTDAVIYMDNISVALVPEPSALTLLGLAGFGVGWVSLRRRNSSARMR